MSRPPARAQTQKPRERVNDWERFGQHLTATLDALEDSQYLILTVHGRHRFVQFAHQGKWGIRVECVSDEYLPATDHLGERDKLALRKLGWHAPTLRTFGARGVGDDTEGSTNWFLDFTRPVDYGALVDLVIQTLRKVYRLRHPSALRYKAFSSDGATILLPALMIAPEAETPVMPSRGGATPSLFQRVVESASYAGEVSVEANSVVVAVDGVVLTVIVEEPRMLARIISPLFPADAFVGDLASALNRINSEHIAFGYTYFRDGEVRYASEVLLEPFHPDLLVVSLQASASVVRGLRLSRDELAKTWTRLET